MLYKHFTKKMIIYFFNLAFIFFANFVLAKDDTMQKISYYSIDLTEVSIGEFRKFAETINYKTPGWFTIDTQAPDPGQVVFVDFEDRGRNNDDFLTNDKSFSITIEGREQFSFVDIQRKLDSGDFTSTLKEQNLTVDGAYTYRAIIRDSAGNSSTTPELTFNLETILPVITDNSLSLGQDDTGISTTDLLTKIQQPSFTFGSEAGLRAFLTKGLLAGSSS